jgi:hydrogenase small subunit
MLTRREFLEMSGRLAAVMGMGAAATPRIAEALEELSSGGVPVVWIQGLSCSGCSVSLLNTQSPDPVGFLTQYAALLFHSTLSTATGHQSLEIIDTAIEKGGFVLVVEGAIPEGMPEACLMGGKPVADWVARAAKKAVAVLTVGTCSSFGGMPAAENNPTGAISAPDFLARKSIETPYICLPGCPAHPEWTVGTVVHVVKFGIPELDEKHRPLMFYAKPLHDQCPRFADYERENYAQTFGEPGCLFELGCMGPKTHADCTVRFWNHGVNTCIKAGAPCVGCASEHFVAKANLPLYTKTRLDEREEA